ncbi:MAG: hypothetical protein ACOX3J_01045 [Clostridia bacterium]|jgi:hypothetical protein
MSEDIVIGGENEDSEIKTGIKGTKRSWVVSVFVCLFIILVLILF